MFTFYQILQEFHNSIGKNELNLSLSGQNLKLLESLHIILVYVVKKKEVFHIYPFLDGFWLVPNLTKIFDRGLGSFRVATHTGKTGKYLKILEKKFGA